MGYFGDGLYINVIASQFLNLQCQAYSVALGKFLLLAFMAKVAKNSCQTTIEKT